MDPVRQRQERDVLPALGQLDAVDQLETGEDEQSAFACSQFQTIPVWIPGAAGRCTRRWARACDGSRPAAGAPVDCAAVIVVRERRGEFG